MWHYDAPSMVLSGHIHDSARQQAVYLTAQLRLPDIRYLPIQKSVTALGDLKAEQLAMLKPGEAYVWANKSTEPIFSQKAVKIRLRPRATLHGGSTKTAG